MDEEEAPGYYDVVKDPIDFQTMRKKITEGDYGSGQDAAAGLYEDFLLLFDNCALYNEEGGDVADEAARLLGLLPEAFAVTCSSLSVKRKNPKGR